MNMTHQMPRIRSTRMKSVAALSFALLTTPAAHALDAAQWQAVAPIIQAALECRSKPDTTSAAWKALPRDEQGGIKPIKPAPPFAVFGLPVQEVAIFIDANGELGESYSATVSASAAAARTSAKLGASGERATRMGALTLSADSPAQLTCTVAGSYDESDYQER